MDNEWPMDRAVPGGLVAGVMISMVRLPPSIHP